MAFHSGRLEEWQLTGHLALAVSFFSLDVEHPAKQSGIDGLTRSAGQDEVYQNNLWAAASDNHRGLKVAATHSGSVIHKKHVAKLLQPQLQDRSWQHAEVEDAAATRIDFGQALIWPLRSSSCGDIFDGGKM